MDKFCGSKNPDLNEEQQSSKNPILLAWNRIVNYFALKFIQQLKTL